MDGFEWDDNDDMSLDLGEDNTNLIGGNAGTGIGNTGNAGGNVGSNTGGGILTDEFDSIGSDDIQFQSPSGIPDNNADNSGMSVKKTALITVGVGVGVITVILAVAAIMKGNKNTNTGSVTQPSNIENNVSTGTNNTPTQQAPSVAQPSNTEGWSSVTSSENVTFEDEYKDFVFTVTDVQHLAKVSGSNIVIKTHLSGSLSGFSGVYEIDVPYSLGVYLSIGSEFDVKVLIGNFNGKNVVGDIKY